MAFWHNRWISRKVRIQTDVANLAVNNWWWLLTYMLHFYFMWHDLKWLAHLSWTSIILLPPSTTIHSILPVQCRCLIVFFHNLCPSIHKYICSYCLTLLIWSYCRSKTLRDPALWHLYYGCPFTLPNQQCQITAQTFLRYECTNSNQEQECYILYLLFVDDNCALTAPENNKMRMGYILKSTQQPQSKTFTIHFITEQYCDLSFWSL